jgi:hypothetical protein
MGRATLARSFTKASAVAIRLKQRVRELELALVEMIVTHGEACREKETTKWILEKAGTS